MDRLIILSLCIFTSPVADKAIVYKGTDSCNNMYAYLEADANHVIWTRSLPIDVTKSFPLSSTVVCIGTDIATPDSLNNSKNQCPSIAVAVIPDNIELDYYIAHKERHRNHILSAEFDDALCDPQVVGATEIGSRIIITLNTRNDRDKYLWWVFDRTDGVNVVDSVVIPDQPDGFEHMSYALESYIVVDEHNVMIMCWDMYDTSKRPSLPWHLVSIVDGDGKECWHAAYSYTTNADIVAYTPQYGIPVISREVFGVTAKDNILIIQHGNTNDTFRIERNGSQTIVVNE